MTFRETFYNVKQLMVNRLIDFGLEDADIDLGWTTLLTLAQNTRITIDVPSNLVYSDDFAITGTLETATYRRLAYKTLKLKVGNTVVATTETDINGAYSFTTSPVSMGNHSFQVIFEGTNIHQPSQSSVINRTIGKETSIINLDMIPTAHINGSTVVAGTLKSDEAELLKNKTMKLDTVSGNTLTTTTNNYGQFSFTLTDIPSFNNISVTCYFEGDEYYSPSTITIPVAVYQETLELTSDKNILSYADDDYAILTVQYKDTGDMNLGAGKEIDLYRIYEVNDIQLTSDKDILSYADSDTCILTATLKDNEGKTTIVDGETIFFYKQVKESITDSVSCPANTRTLIYDGEEISSGESVGFTIQCNGYFSMTFKDSSHTLISNTMHINGTYNVIVSLDDGMVDITIEGGGGEAHYISFNPTQIIVTPNVACTVTNVVYHNWSSVGSGNTVGGIASCTYNSQGIGDVVFYARCEGILSSEIYVEDCIYYFKNVDKSSDFTPMLCEGGTYGSVSYDNTYGVHFVHGSKATMFTLPVELPTNCIIEADFTYRNGGTFGIVLTNGVNGNADGCIIDGTYIGAGYRYINSSWQGSLVSSVQHQSSLPFTVKVTKTGNSVYTTVGNVSSNSFTTQFSTGSVYTGIIGNNALYVYLDGFKIKAL